MASPTPTTPTPTLLIVDDARDIAQLLTGYFRRTGFRTLAAHTGHEAIESFKRTAPNAIILDLGLPDQDGLDVCRMIRQSSDLPIVMLTKRSTEADREAGMAAGANAYITKPFDVLELEAAVRSLLPDSIG